jgi:hypothetical protein
MSKFLSFTAACLLGFSSLHAAEVAPTKPEAKPATPALPPGITPEMMQSMMATMQPGPKHAELAKQVGEWDADVEHYMPGMPVEKSKGSAKVTMVMNGRFLREDFKGTMMGQPFEGMMLLGYDNNLKRYDSTWIDSMGTGMMVTNSKGDTPEELSGSFYCPMAKKEITARLVTKFVNNGKHIFEMHAPGLDGKEALMMRITYNRKK